MKYAKENNIVGIQLNNAEWKHKDIAIKQIERELNVKLDSNKWNYTHVKGTDIHLITQVVEPI